MNEVQLSIVVIIAVIVLAIIVYYIYQEHKFKKIIEANFNQAADDVIKHDQGLIFDNQANEISAFKSSVEDRVIHEQDKLEQAEMAFDPLLNDSEVIKQPKDIDFIDYDKIEFPYANIVERELDHVIDITFPKAVKIKMLPDISQYITKSYVFFVLDKSGGWQIYQAGNKYVVRGLKLVLTLVDNEGVVNDLQLNNIYNELAKFALHHEAHIRQTDSELQIRKLQQQLKGLNNVELELALYLVNKDKLEFRHLQKYFDSKGFSFNHGYFEKIENGRTLFRIGDEFDKPLNLKSSYQLLSINAKLQHLEYPMLAVESIFDFAEDYMQIFESRLLTNNKLVLAEKDYNTLVKQVNVYINNMNRQGVQLGSALIMRVFP